MKKSYILIAVAMVAALTMVSCKNNKSQEPTQEEVQEMKQALADSVLAEIDAFADEYIDASNQSFKIQYFELTEKEKLTKPDYLLEPSYANNLVSKSQKIIALAFFSVDRLVRVIYDMPTDEIDEVMGGLIIELNHPWGEYKKKDVPVSELMKKAYQTCKENGDLAYFWQFQNAILCETNYILAKNPELFFSKISEDYLIAYNKRWASLKSAIRKLSEYDEQMKSIMNTSFSNPTNEITDEELKECYFKDVKTAIETYKFDKLNQIEKRNALLQ